MVYYKKTIMENDPLWVNLTDIFKGNKRYRDVIDELEERELITRDRVPGDRRSYALHPTEAGLVLYERTLEAVTQHEKLLLAHVEPDKLKDLVNILNLIKSTT